MPAYCYTGTRPQAGAPAYVWLTEDIAKAALGGAVLLWLPSSFLPREPALINIAAFCSTLPVDPGPFDPAWLLDPIGPALAANWIGRWLQAKKWNDYCE